MSFDKHLDIVKQAREKSDVSLISFSRGKDAIATYLLIRETFGENIVPFYLYGVPDLEFVEESLAYYEQMMGTGIYRLPQPSFYNNLNSFTFQPPEPERVAAINGWKLPKIDQTDIQNLLIKDLDLPEQTYTAVGVKAADSLNRRLLLNQNQGINHKEKKYFPLAWYSKKETYEIIRRAGWKLPIDYTLFNVSLDGIKAKYLIPIKEHFPRDYQKILEWFPLAELEVFRYEKYMKEHHGTKTA